MTSRIVLNRHDKDEACRLIMSRNTPFTLTIVKGKHRSVEQNRLQRLWVSEATEQQQDETAEQKRGFCKLHFGVPILRNENDAFREVYDRLIRPRSYEEKLELMMVPMDMPVTRIMTTGQKTRYLNDLWGHFTGLGCVLTEPPSMWDQQGQVA